MEEGARFYFQKNIVYEKKADDKFLKKEILPLLEKLKVKLEETSGFDQSELEKVFSAFLEDQMSWNEAF